MNRAFAAALLFVLAAGQAAAAVKSGLDVLRDSNFEALRGKRIGLVTNHTGRDANGKSTVELLAGAPDVTLAALFSPEHGFTGALEQDRVGSKTLKVGERHIPIHSLYAGGIAGMRPLPEQLKDLDALVFDIQDIGARFYTYLTTMAMALEESSKAGVEFVVLDRPNPVSGLGLEGPILGDLSLRQVTATAYFPVPIRHGLTAAEMALLHNSEVKHPRLTIVKLEGWSRAMWYDETGLPWIPPSPNMPDVDAAALYPGIAIFEASNIAVGRGTPVPFRWIGAPWMDAKMIVARLQKAKLEGITFAAQDYTPTKSVFQSTACHGVRMTITDRNKLRSTEVFVQLNAALRDLHPKEFVWRWDEAKRMTGTDDFRKLYESGAGVRKFLKLFRTGSKFAGPRKTYLLY